MPAPSLKKLYLASTIEELDKKIVIEKSLLIKSTSNLRMAADRLYQSAEKCNLGGDEEKAYVQYMKLVELFMFMLKERPELKEPQYEQKKLRSFAAASLCKAAEMKNSLIERYAVQQDALQAQKKETNVGMSSPDENEEKRIEQSVDNESIISEVSLSPLKSVTYPNLDKEEPLKITTNGTKASSYLSYPLGEFNKIANGWVSDVTPEKAHAQPPINRKSKIRMLDNLHRDTTSSDKQTNRDLKNSVLASETISKPSVQNIPIINRSLKPPQFTSQTGSESLNSGPVTKQSDDKMDKTDLSSISAEEKAEKDSDYIQFCLRKECETEETLCIQLREREEMFIERIKELDQEKEEKEKQLMTIKEDNKKMQNVFMMKPEAMILFIDNASRGFHKKVSQAADDCGLETECEPQNHMMYRSKVLKRFKYGCSSLSSASVAVQLWKKRWPLTPSLLRRPIFSHMAPSTDRLETTNICPQDVQTASDFERDSVSKNGGETQLSADEPDSPVVSETRGTNLKTTLTKCTSVRSFGYSTELEPNGHNSGDFIAAKIRNVVLGQIYEKLRSEICLKSSATFLKDCKLGRCATSRAESYICDVSQLLLEKKRESRLSAQVQRPCYFTTAEVRRIIMPQIVSMLENKETYLKQLSLTCACMSVANQKEN